MDMTPKEYQDYVAKKQKKSPIAKDTALAFLIGGAICTLGQGIMELWTAAGLDKESAGTMTSVSLVFLSILLTGLDTQDAGTATSVSLVFLSVLLTGLNLYNKIGRFGGAGTLVPITGFANAVASPAIDFKAEGIVLGVGAKMFTIAGPVIVYGTVASVIYGLIYWITTIM